MSKTSKAPSLGGRGNIRKTAKLSEKPIKPVPKKKDGPIQQQTGLDEGLILC